MPPTKVQSVLPVYKMGFDSLDEDGNATGQKKEITLDVSKLTGKRCEEISEFVGTVRAEDSDFVEDRYPMEEGEDHEEWKKRCGKAVDGEFMSRRVGESIEAHVKRINTPRLSNMAMAFRLLNFYAETSGQKDQVLTEAEFKNAIWGKARETLYKFFVLGGEIPIVEIYPKMQQNQN